MATEWRIDASGLGRMNHVSDRAANGLLPIADVGDTMSQ